MLTLALTKAGLLTGRSAGKRPSGLQERGRIVAQTRNSAANALQTRNLSGSLEVSSSPHQLAKMQQSSARGNERALP